MGGGAAMLEERLKGALWWGHGGAMLEDRHEGGAVRALWLQCWRSA